MTLDFSYESGRTVEQIDDTVRKHHRVETWAFEGSAGDRVLFDAHVPEAVERIVVMGHGVDNSRKARYIEVSGKRFTRHGTVVVGMDAPFHGDRIDARMIESPVGTLVDLMARWVKDHRQLLDVIESRWPGTPVGYAGFSMGGLFGVPLIASDDRIRAAAIVIAGSTRVSYPDRFGPLDDETVAALAVTDPAVYAPQTGDRPVLLLNADEDEIISRHAAFALYDAFVGPKELVFMPGTHTEWKHAARWFRRLETFFEETL